METILIKVSDRTARNWRSALRNSLERRTGGTVRDSADLSQIAECVLAQVVADEKRAQAEEALADRSSA